MSLEIRGRRQKTGGFILEIGPAIFNLHASVVRGLADVLSNREESAKKMDEHRTQQRLEGYRALASKIAGMEDSIVQSILGQVTPAQIISLARVSQSKAVYNKIVNNLSRQNARQFEEDYRENTKISVHQASMHMEALLPVVRRAIRLRKEQL